ncbi:F-box only 4 isoform X1 [Brachionus plicatilis]|uniref:F-box only 4 isoform X1 n=1 Tax=Brachionus plicatilis TaxID=10195 RepID=A0A3M7S984_BRAPC|nr:F-box only 4 isoform X1 [Brachionus plicatilis]
MDKLATNLDELPFDLMIEIMDRLNPKDLGKLCQVNKNLYKISNDEFYWKQRYLHDLPKWNVLYSHSYTNSNFEAYKERYTSICPELVIQNQILDYLETFQRRQKALNARSTSENISIENSFRLSATSVLSKFSNFFNLNIFGPRSEPKIDKLVMFGPGLETTTSCLVTKILWDSDFKTLGMIPGKDGYGSGIKLKLFNSKPFNLTILYTNVKKIRSSSKHCLDQNRLLVATQNENDQVYELQPRVREACSDAVGFVYIIDSMHLKKLIEDNDVKEIENYRFELKVLMKEMDKNLPLLILSCNTNKDTESMSPISCAKIIEYLDIANLDREWCIRDCQIFQDKLKDAVLGFEWILSSVNNKSLINRIKKIENEDF